MTAESHIALSLASQSPKIEHHGDVSIITFTAGRFACMQDGLARELEGLIDDLGTVHLLLDFTNVMHITSLELGTLINLHKQLQQSGGRLTLFNLNLDVFEVFAVTRLETLINICR